MGRAVGGASSIGCAAFGLGSLIIGIGLVVWLGSNVTTSTTGGGRADNGDTAVTDVSSLSSDLEDLVSEYGASPGLEPLGATITVTADLPAEGTAAVAGHDLSPGPIDLTSCLTKAGSTDGVAGCDAATTVSATVDGDGTLALDYPLHRVLTVEGVAYDCAARAGACSLFGHRADNPLDTGLVASLAFAAGLPPVDAAAPPPG